MKRRVVITGLGTYNPLGNDVESTWQRAAAGESGIGPITLFDASDFKTRFAGEVKGFDPVAHFGRKEARRMDRSTQLALAAAGQALADAGLPIGESERVGVVLGTGIGGLGTIAENVQTFHQRGHDRVSPFFIPMMLLDSPAAAISMAYGFRGPNMSVATACASANNALGEAARMIERGTAEVMVSGGAEATIIPLAIAGFNVMGALSTRNDAPQAAARPFDKDRDGFVASEGAAILILEELTHAQARGARIYAEFLGYGSSADAYHLTQPLESGAGATQAMRAALTDANLPPTAIDYVNAHGTSTPLNDKSETAAIKYAFGEYAYDLPVSSTKSMHGHLLGAAGAIEALISILALQYGLIPPTINYETPDPDCDLDYVPNTARPAALCTFMSNAFGLGGHNATIIVGKL